MARRRRNSYNPRQPRDQRGRWSRGGAAVRRNAPGRGLRGTGGYRAGRGGLGGNTAAFGRHAARDAKGSLPVPSRAHRFGRGAFTTGVTVAPYVVLGVAGISNPLVGAGATAGALALRRNRQRERGETGLRSTYTGRRLN